MFLFKKKDNSLKELYKRLDLKPIRYVTERDLETYVEKVIGREGRLNIYDDELSVYCSGHEAFRCKLEGSEIGELMSLEGATIKGVDINSGKLRTVVAYYKYYRPVK